MPKPKTKLLVLIRLDAHRSTHTNTAAELRAQVNMRIFCELFFLFLRYLVSFFAMCVCVCVYLLATTRWAFPRQCHTVTSKCLPARSRATKSRRDRGREWERETEREAGRQANSDGDGANNMWSSVWHKCSLCMCVHLCVCVCVRVIKNNNNNNTHRQPVFLFLFLYAEQVGRTRQTLRRGRNSPWT